MNYLYDIRGDDFSSAGAASSAIKKKKLRQLGLPPAVIKRTAIVMIDEGPGIPDVGMAMTEGYSTATDAARSLGFGAGMGHPNIERNVDDLEIRSAVGEGTVVTLTLHLPENAE